jgi:hypothetical protein
MALLATILSEKAFLFFLFFFKSKIIRKSDKINWKGNTLGCNLTPNCVLKIGLKLSEGRLKIPKIN